MLDTIAQNLLDPAILFFALGTVVGLLRSNLEVPAAIAKFLALYLLMALGLKGGASLAKDGLPIEGALALAASLFMAAAVPAYSFVLLKRRLDPFDAAAVAATYGSISAVTFIATQQFLISNQIEFGGYMTVAMVLMESPAIVMAVLLASLVRARKTAATTPSDAGTAGRPLPALSFRKVLREALTDGHHMLLIGSLIIGFIVGDAGTMAMAPFTVDIFKGLVAFFLLEMGLLVGRQISEGQARVERPLLLFALVAPPVNAGIAIAVAWTLGLQRGDAMLLAVLSASASYIVVPAIVRYAIPEARPGVYFSMALGLTFPFNIIIGIPLYFAATGMLWP